MTGPKAAGEGRWKRRLLAASLPFLIAGGMEALLRAAGFSYPVLPPLVVWNAEEDGDLLGENTLHKLDGRTLWAPRPGASVPWGKDEVVSGAGFRGRDPNPSAQPKILVLGDSSTFGYGVAGPETYASRLEASLREDEFPSVQVLNGGLIGSTVIQGLERYRWIREGWNPDVVVLAFGAVNEHWGTSGLDDLAKLEKVRVLEAAPGSEGLSRRLRHDLRLVQLAAWVADLPRGGRSRILRKRAEKSASEAQVGQYLKPGYHRRVSVEQFRAALLQFRDETEARGTRLILLHMPRPRDTEEERPPVLDYDPVLASFAVESGSTLARGHEDFRASGISEERLFVDPYHPSAEGHARLAKLLTATLSADGLKGQ